MCIERPENSGSINLLPSKVSFGQVTLELIGGQKQCGFIKPGKTVVRVTSKEPYSPTASDPAACKSEPKVIRAKKGEVLTLAVWPAIRDSSHACGWLIKKHGEQPYN